MGPLGIGIGITLALSRPLAASSDQPPAGYVFLTDTDGTVLTDADGAFLMEAA